MIPYRFYYNSEGMIRINDQFVGRKAMTTHVPTLNGYRPGDELTLAWEGEFESAPDSTPGFSACEELFHIFNAPWERPNEYAGPSMSVGDVVVFNPGAANEIAFACDNWGFKKVTGTGVAFSEVQPQPAIWKRDQAAVIEYLRAKSEDGVSLSDEENSLIYG